VRGITGEAPLAFVGFVQPVQQAVERCTSAASSSPVAANASRPIVSAPIASA